MRYFFVAQKTIALYSLIQFYCTHCFVPCLYEEEILPGFDENTKTIWKEAAKWKYSIFLRSHRQRKVIAASRKIIMHFSIVAFRIRALTNTRENACHPTKWFIFFLSLLLFSGKNGIHPFRSGFLCFNFFLSFLPFEMQHFVSSTWNGVKMILFFILKIKRNKKIAENVQHLQLQARVCHFAASRKEFSINSRV